MGDKSVETLAVKFVLKHLGTIPPFPPNDVDFSVS